MQTNNNNGYHSDLHIGPIDIYMKNNGNNEEILQKERSDSIIRSSNGYREYVNSQSNLEPFDVEDVFDDDVSDMLSDFDITDAFEETDNFLTPPM